jgi:hypothetical protein
MGAAVFAAVSLELGFVILAGILLFMALLLLTLREPARSPHLLPARLAGRLRSPGRDIRETGIGSR